jgi:formylglycine-generating enzyme required for sulfatase activity
MITNRTYVTVAEYEKFLVENKKHLPFNWDEQLKHPNFPVVNVTGINADAYCKYMNGRLPTDKELEDEFCPLWEWTSSSKESLRIIRGGAWVYSSWLLRVSFRGYYLAVVRSDYVGFRCIK